MFSSTFGIAQRSMSGLWATLLTNVLSYVIVYTAVTLRSYDIQSNLHIIVPLIFIPSTVCGVLVPTTLFSTSGEDSTSFLVVSHIYGAVRIGSIVFNIVCYFLLRKKLSMIKKKSPTTMQLTPAIDTPLHALAARFKYYPIVQVLSRLGVSYYENIYGHDYEFDTGSSLKKKIAVLWYVASLPSAGLGFFVVFLVVTPGAYRCFKRVLGCWRGEESDREVRLLGYGRHSTRSRSCGSRSRSTEYGYLVMRCAESSEHLTTGSSSQHSLYEEWSEEELTDELIACLSRNTEGDVVMEMDPEQEYLSFYDDEKHLARPDDDSSVAVSVISGLTNDTGSTPGGG
jgi:hypothetical protein